MEPYAFDLNIPHVNPDTAVSDIVAALRQAADVIERSQFENGFITDAQDNQIGDYRLAPADSPRD